MSEKIIGSDPRLMFRGKRTNQPVPNINPVSDEIDKTATDQDLATTLLELRAVIGKLSGVDNAKRMSGKSNPNPDLGKMLTYSQQLSGLTIKELARKTGYGRPDISLLLLGTNRYVSYDKIRAVLNVLNPPYVEEMLIWQASGLLPTQPDILKKARNGENTIGTSVDTILENEQLTEEQKKRLGAIVYPFVAQSARLVTNQIPTQLPRIPDNVTFSQQKRREAQVEEVSILNAMANSPKEELRKKIYELFSITPNAGPHSLRRKFLVFADAADLLHPNVRQIVFGMYIKSLRVSRGFTEQGKFEARLGLGRRTLSILENALSPNFSPSHELLQQFSEQLTLTPLEEAVLYRLSGKINSIDDIVKHLRTSNTALGNKVDALLEIRGVSKEEEDQLRGIIMTVLDNLIALQKSQKKE